MSLENPANTLQHLLLSISEMNLSYCGPNEAHQLSNSRCALVSLQSQVLLTKF